MKKIAANLFVSLSLLSTVAAPLCVSALTLTRTLSFGTKGDDVASLQQFLKDTGYFTYPQITGYFGPVTEAAVADLQYENNLESVGYVGPKTRALIAQLTASTTPLSTGQGTSTISTTASTTTTSASTSTSGGLDYIAQWNNAHASGGGYAPGFGGGGGGPAPVTAPVATPYVAQAVHFDGNTDLSNPALSSTDNQFLSVSGWFKSNAFSTIYVVDPVNYFNYMFTGDNAQRLLVQASNADGSSYTYASTPDLSSGWHNVIMTFETDLAPSPTREWWVSGSSDGTKLLAGAANDYLYVSTDSGATWARQTSAGVKDWIYTAVSGNGNVLLAVAGDSSLAISTDGGSTWNAATVAGASTLLSIAVSNDGSKIALVDGNADGSLYVSTTTGSTWTAVNADTGGDHWTGLAMTPDGSKIYAVGDQEVSKSLDGGSTWTPVSVPANGGLQSAAMSSDGTKIALGTFDGTGHIFVSTSSGSSWTTVTPQAGANWYFLAGSLDLSTLAAGDGQSSGGFIWTSKDLGNTWTHGADGNFYQWTEGTISSDGTKIAAGAVADGAIVHTSPDGGATWLYDRVIPNTRIVVGYVDGVRSISGYTDSGPAFDVAMNGFLTMIGEDGYGDNYTGDMADLWIAPGQSLLSGSTIPLATLRKFIDADGKPVDLGSDCSKPTGTAPAMCFSGDATDFGTNKGTGGAFTTTGTLTNATDSPSD